MKSHQSNLIDPKGIVFLGFCEQEHAIVVGVN